MAMEDLIVQRARDYIRSKPYLVWSTKNYDRLSPESIFENIISNGDWPDFLTIIDIFGIKLCAEIFNTIKHRKRCNLRPRTVNLFTLYFEKHA